MNVPPLLSAENAAVYCPSCAARVADLATPGESFRCPNCGTEFQANAKGEIDPMIEEPRMVEQTASAPKRLSTEEILLERLKNEPPAKKPMPMGTVVIILLAILAISVAIYKGTEKKDQYAHGIATDSSEMFQHRIAMQHIIDSLKTIESREPQNANVHLNLADAYFDAGYWDNSTKEFQTYLAANPKDADARVDYAYALGQKSGDMNAAVAQIDTALKYKPDHLNALVNAGILTTRTINESNHTEALAKARNYFVRAKAVADTSDPTAAGRIEKLINEIDSTGNRLAGPSMQ